jgi:hypothetical protein
VRSHIGMPVHEGAIRILLPRPHMQRVERREPKAIGTLKEVKELSHEFRRTRMPRIPCVDQFLDEWCRQTMRSRIEPMKKMGSHKDSFKNGHGNVRSATLFSHDQRRFVLQTSYTLSFSEDGPAEWGSGSIRAEIYSSVLYAESPQSEAQRSCHRSWTIPSDPQWARLYFTQGQPLR